MTEKRLNRTDYIKSLLKARTVKIIIIVFLCLIVLPPIVHIVVLLASDVYLLQAGDILVYWGSLVAFIGTATLALVAWRQNKELVMLNKRMQNIEMAKNVAIFDIANVSSPEWCIPVSTSSHMSFLLMYDIRTVAGVGLNCLVALNHFYFCKDYPEDILERMYQQGIAASVRPNDYKVLRKMKRFVNSATVSWAIKVPRDDNLFEGSFVAVFRIEHDDIYGKHHKDILTVVYSNTGNMLEYENHHIDSPPPTPPY